MRGLDSKDGHFLALSGFLETQKNVFLRFICWT